MDHPGFFPYEGTPDAQATFVRALTNEQLHEDMATLARSRAIDLAQVPYDAEVTARQARGTWPAETPEPPVVANSPGAERGDSLEGPQIPDRRP